MSTQDTDPSGGSLDLQLQAATDDFLASVITVRESFETELLTQAENLVGLAALNRVSTRHARSHAGHGASRHPGILG